MKEVCFWIITLIFGTAFVLFLCFAVGKSNRGLKHNGLPDCPACKAKPYPMNQIKEFVYKDHQYIRFTGHVVHNPDCKCGR